jgi:hypothetical protein
MRDVDLKAIVVSALRPDPDFAHLVRLSDCSATQQSRLLRWLDQSGLALYFLDRLQTQGVSNQLPASLVQALERRLHSNRARTADMFEEFRGLVTAFSDRGIRFCALKGPTLIPDFCPAAHLRHQTDFDFLIPQESFSVAAQVLQSGGYAQTELRPTGEATYATPLLHVPTANDDIYAKPRHREVDLHPSLELDFYGVSMHTPSDQLARLQQKTLQDLTFPTLADDDIFSLQVLHAFNHLLGSWIRLSWLFEIRHFLNLHHNDSVLWSSVISRQQASDAARERANNRNAFGLILSLTQRLFPRPIPRALDDWCVQPLPTPIRAWIDQFGLRFAFSNLDGAKLSLFVHREFFDDRRAWRAYVFTRILPFGRQSSIGNVSTAAPGARMKTRVSQWLHSAGRALFHASELVSFPVEAIRWKRALRAAHRQRALIPPSSDTVRSSANTGNALAGLARLPDGSHFGARWPNEVIRRR